MIRRSTYKSSITASPGWCKPGMMIIRNNTFEYPSEMKRVGMDGFSTVKRRAVSDYSRTVIE